MADPGAARILVTGATGNVGSHLIPRLATAGVRARALVHERGGDAFEGIEGVELVDGDLGDPSSIDSAMDGVQALFMLTPNDPNQETWERTLVDAARGHAVRRVVKLSVVGADPDSEATILRAHGRGERIVRESGLEWTALRCCEYMQNLLLAAPTIESDGAIFGTGVGDAPIAMVDTRDVAATAAAALIEDGGGRGVVEVTGPEAMSFDEMARRVSAIIGRRASYVELAASEYQEALVADGVPDWYALALAQLYEAFGRGVAAGVAPTVRELTGDEPRSIDDFARDHSSELGGG